MTRDSLRRTAFAVIAVPLALGLAACGESADSSGAPTGGPIANVAPPAGKAWNEMIAVTEDGGYRMGNPEAPIKLVEFASLTCSHCAEFAEASAVELAETFVASGRVSYEFRNFVRDPIDITAAQLVRCAPPEAFFALTDQVLAFQPALFENWQKAGEAQLKAIDTLPVEKRGLGIAQAAGLTDFFATRGISRDQAATCLADPAKAQDLARRTEAQSKQFDITGTPTFVINGSKVQGNTWAEIKPLLENAGAR
jgi:protein-disulfide isomerase